MIRVLFADPYTYQSGYEYSSLQTGWHRVADLFQELICLIQQIKPVNFKDNFVPICHKNERC